MPIRKLRELDDDTIIADGPKFDLPLVMEKAFGILRTLYNRAMMRFPGCADPVFSISSDDIDRPFDDDSYPLIKYMFDECKLTKFDVTMFSATVEFGPFMADLYLLGFDCLHGTVKNCHNHYERNWDELDPTPAILFMMRRGMIDPLGEKELDFLEQTLAGYASHGIVWDLYDADSGENLALRVQFPHSSFGAGEGPLKICRYLYKVQRDGEVE